MTEFCDRYFRPDLRPLVDGSRHKAAIERLHITPNATPVPSARKQRVGIWFGQVLTSLGEFGVIAVALDIEERLTASTGNWFYGTSHKNSVGDSPTPFETMADAAITQVPSPLHALRELDLRFPNEAFPTNKRPLQLPDQTIPQPAVPEVQATSGN